MSEHLDYALIEVYKDIVNQNLKIDDKNTFFVYLYFKLPKGTMISKLAFEDFIFNLFYVGKGHDRDESYIRKLKAKRDDLRFVSNLDKHVKMVEILEDDNEICICKVSSNLRELKAILFTSFLISGQFF